MPASPAEDRHRRMVNYGIAMSIRVVCILAVFVVPGWFKLLPAFAAVLLPYLAVVAANAPRATAAGAARHNPRDLGPGGDV